MDLLVSNFIHTRGQMNDKDESLIWALPVLETVGVQSPYGIMALEGWMLMHVAHGNRIHPPSRDALPALPLLLLALLSQPLLPTYLWSAMGHLLPGL